MPPSIVSSTCTLFTTATGFAASARGSSFIKDVLTNAAQHLKSTIQSLNLVQSPLKEVCPGLECRLPPLFRFVLTPATTVVAAAAVVAAALSSCSVVSNCTSHAVCSPNCSSVTMKLATNMLFITLGLCYEVEGYE